MVKFYVTLTKARIEQGMDKEVALQKVPAKYRNEVRRQIEE